MKISAKFDQFALKVGLGLFIVAFVIRLLGIGWGLPNGERHHSLHPDEEIVWMNSQQIEPARFDFTPGFYNYGTLFLTIARVTSDVVMAYTGGVNESGSNAPEVLGRVIKGGRIVSALAGAGLAWVGFLILYRRTHIVGAISSGAVLALAPGLVVHSRFMTVDVFATFLLALAVYWASKMIPIEGEKSDLQKCIIFSGIFTGLCAGTKYTGLLVFLIPAITLGYVWFENRETKVAKLMLILFACTSFSFFVSTPGMLLESSIFWKDFTYELAHTATGHGIVFAGLPTGPLTQLPNLFMGVGILTGMMGVYGLIAYSFKFSKERTALAPLLVSSIVVFAILLVLIGRAEVKFLRYTFPLMVFVAIGFGVILGESHGSKSKWGRAVVAFGILSLGGVGGGMVYDLTVTGWMTGMDSQAEMAKVIRESEVKSVGLVSDPWFYTPTLYPEANSGPYRGPKYRFEAMMSAQNPQVLRYLPADYKERQDWDVRLLTEMKPESVVFSSFELEGYDRLATNGNIPDGFVDSVNRYRAFVKQLESEYEPYAIVGGGISGGGKNAGIGLHPYQTVHDMMYIRPILYLWKRKTDLTTISSGTSTTSEPTGEPATTP